jgi:hypothetical protein
VCPKQANTPKKKPSNGRTRWRKPVNRAPLPVPSSRRTPRKKTGSGNEGVLTGISGRRTTDHLRSFLCALDGYLSFQDVQTFTYSLRCDACLRQPIGRGRLGCAGERIPSLAKSLALRIASRRQAARRLVHHPALPWSPDLEASGNSSSRTPYSSSSRRLL